MVEPSMQTLYLMQNEFGFIKIGRSTNPERRLRDLIATEKCHIEIIKVFANCGDMEEMLHIKMDAFRIFGEWFIGNDDAIRTLEAAVEITGITWPYEFSVTQAETWVEETLCRRGKQSTRNYLARQLGIIRNEATSQAQNHSILRLWYDLAFNEWPDVSYRKTRTGEEARWRQPNDRSLVPIPDFVGDISCALSIWPPALRPEGWSGTPLDCCAEGLWAWTRIE